MSTVLQGRWRVAGIAILALLLSGCQIVAGVHIEKDWGPDLRTRSEIRWESNK